jgi:transposase
MSYGYSQSLVEANKNADATSLGVALGRLCIERGIPVTEVAGVFKVSRATVYNWFWGQVTPNRSHNELIERFIARHKKRKLG